MLYKCSLSLSAFSASKFRWLDYIDIPFEYVHDLNMVDVVFLEYLLQFFVGLSDENQVGDGFEEACHWMNVADSLDDVGLVEHNDVSIVHFTDFIGMRYFW